MRKGFLFAPLVGTIVVLAVLLFITHILSLERTGVALTTTDSYHNRLVSLLETTRTDTASAFKIGVEKTIVDFTITQGWASTSIFTSGNKWSVCDNLRGQMHAGVCSITPRAGLPYWLTLLGQPVYFEGVIFKPCDEKKYEDFIKAMMNMTKCGTVFSRNEMFDCNSLDKKSLECVGLPGCDDGTFWLRMEITNIYDLLPRLCSEDGSGNQIRSETISSENFAMHIRLRTFDYVKKASNITDTIAFGSGPGCEGILGIEDGLCVGKGCKNLTGTWGNTFPCADESPLTTENAAISKLETKLNDLARISCKEIKEQVGRTVIVKDCENSLIMALKRKIKTQMDCGGIENNWCAYVEAVRISLDMIDSNSNYGVTASEIITYPFTICVPRSECF